MRTVSIPREQIFQGPLVLVNRAHPLHEKERSALTSVDPHHPDILLESRARQLLSACILISFRAFQDYPQGIR